MKKLALYVGSGLLTLTSALACDMHAGAVDGGKMLEGGMRHGGGYFGAIAGFLFFIAGAFIFSLIFWLTYRWVMNDKLKTDKGKKRR